MGRITKVISDYKSFLVQMIAVLFTPQDADPTMNTGTVGLWYRSDLNRMRMKDDAGNVHTIPVESQDIQTGAGAVSVQTRTTILVTTGANALSLANGLYVGQRKTVYMRTDGGDGTLTPATPNGFATITFNDVRDVAELEWTAAGWIIVGVAGATVA
jgi:hypothetical protein